jgi:hypothetical protein
MRPEAPAMATRRGAEAELVAGVEVGSVTRIQSVFEVFETATGMDRHAMGAA